MTTLRFIGRAQLAARLDILSGLHIGAGSDAIEIGGIDNPVIKNPHTGEPYVPGSSLKGKLRYLLEWAFNTVREDGRAWGFDQNDRNKRLDQDDPVLRIFGTPAKREAWDGGPTRLIVRDAALDPKWRDETLNRGWELTEEKTEVTIDRIAGTALEGGLRRSERVPAGAVFDVEMVFRLYDTGDSGARDRACLAWLIQGLDLLEQDALGGSGSRGYGRVRFSNLTLHGFDKDATHSLDNTFRGARFNPKAPDPQLLALIEEATREAPMAA